MKRFSDDENFDVKNRKQALKIMRILKKQFDWTSTLGKGTRNNFPDQVKLFRYEEQHCNLQGNVFDESFWVAFDWYGNSGRINVFNYGTRKPIEFNQICEFLDNELNIKINIEKQFDL